MNQHMKPSCRLAVRIALLVAFAAAYLGPHKSLLHAADANGSDSRAIRLIDPEKPLGGWTFDNGREFPGAQGKLELTQEDEQPTLRLHGDFSKGGKYVQMACKLNEISLASVSFDIKVPSGVGQVTTRLIDGTGQCHQLKIRLNDKGGWQNYTFPIVRYFDSVKSGAPMDIVTRYEKWSGANDGRWHQPAKLFVVLAGEDVLSEGQIAIRNVVFTPTPPTTDVATTTRLDDFGDDVSDNDVSKTNSDKNNIGAWEFNPGHEFPGAEGRATLVPGPQTDRRALRMMADFSKGGRYVGVRNRLAKRTVKSTTALHLQYRTSDATQFSLRLVDSSGQTHQRKGLPLNPDGKWHSLKIDPAKIAGGEHWGGANDAKWHGAIRLIEIMLNERSSNQKTMSLDLADIREDIIVEGQESTQSWSESFEKTAGMKLPEGWQTTGDVSVVNGSLGAGSKTDRFVRLSRNLDNVQHQTSTTSPTFAVNRGAWKLQYRWKSSLHSPDNSFHGSVTLNLFNSAGQRIDEIPLGIGFGKTEWATVQKSIVLPRGAATANVHVALKKTYGEFFFDDLSATRLSIQPAEPIVESIRIASEATGSLFYPQDAVTFDVAVHVRQSLLAADRTLRYSVRDYRGESLFEPAEVPLVKATSNQSRMYKGRITLPKDRLNVGQFYELHLEVPQGVSSPAVEFSGFAILPEAVTKQHAATDIPFTIRNWDSRVRDYFFLADRLGLRMMGVWGGWSQKPPYKPHLPGVEICEKLNAKWITGTPASTIEREGFGKVTEESLAQGMTSFLNAYADRGLAKIALGNEPHGTGQKVLDNVRAYKILYEAIKAFDEDIEVIGTSVEPNEEYFQAGYQKYLDSYDFHIYEHYSKVRKTMAAYRQLMKKYDAVKPIHSTELGLNSQGQARLAVAIELIKKCTVFFAEGGETVSWFTIQYPDPKGKARGQFGDAHCVFDCKFNNYNPRLDAITYYNLINAIAVKKFVNEKQHANGLQTFLFKDNNGQCLQILWNDEQDVETRIDLPPRTVAEIVRIDGFRRKVTAETGEITVTASKEPLLILYRD